MTTFIRILGSFLIATAFVVTVVGIGIRVFHSPDDGDPMLEYEEVDVVSLGDNPQLADAIKREREKYEAPPESSAPPLPPPMPEREIAGFVQLEYTINPDGSVSDVRIIGATPSGVYEEQAIEQVSRRMHAPTFEDGEPVARRATEVIDFSVPASALVDSRNVDQEQEQQPR